MGMPFGSYTQKSNTPKQSQGRSILESLDPMPAFTNRARRQATVLRKHPSGKFHLIITGNCVIGWKVGHNIKKQRNFRRMLLVGDCRRHKAGLTGFNSNVISFPKPPSTLQSQVGGSVLPSPAALWGTWHSYSVSVCLLQQTVCFLGQESHLLTGPLTPRRVYLWKTHSKSC